MISTKEGGATPPPPYAWQVPVVEDMLYDGRSGLTKVTVMGPSLGCPILWKMIPRRRPELRQGEGYHVYAFRGHQLGW